MTWGHLHVTCNVVSSDLPHHATWQSEKQKRHVILIRLFETVLTRILSLFLTYSRDITLKNDLTTSVV